MPRSPGQSDGRHCYIAHDAVKRVVATAAALRGLADHEHSQPLSSPKHACKDARIQARAAYMARPYTRRAGTRPTACGAASRAVRDKSWFEGGLEPETWLWRCPVMMWRCAQRTYSAPFKQANACHKAYSTTYLCCCRNTSCRLPGSRSRAAYRAGVGTRRT